MRERRMEYEKYIIPLSESNPFEVDEFVKIVSKTDFEKLGEMVKSLKNERDQLHHQVTELQSVVDVQKSLLDKVNFQKIESKKEDKKTSFKDLIGL